jgi:hypothetical protein
VLTFDADKHEYRVDGVVRPSVTQVLQKLHDFGMVPAHILEAAQERGTAVHTLTQYHDEGDLDPDSVAPEYAGYLDGWKRFCDDHKPVWNGIEWQGYSERYGFAGTMDRHGTLKGLPWVIDIKTSLASHRVWGMQVSAYRQLLAERWPNMATCRRGTVQLRANGTYNFLAWDDPDDWPAYLSLVNLTNWSTKS